MPLAQPPAVRGLASAIARVILADPNRSVAASPAVVCHATQWHAVRRTKLLHAEAKLMTPKEAVEWIEKEWDLISGCLGKLSEGSYDEEGFTRFIDILKRVDADKNELLNRRFVASTWAIPHMLCELSRIDSLRRDQILKAQMQCSEELTRIYGTP